MKNDLLELLSSFENLRFTGSVNLEDIEVAQQALGLRFADDYTQYLLHYGSVLFDDGILCLTGLKYAYEDVVKCTLEEREVDDTTPLNMYVIEFVGVEGLTIWQDSNGIVYYKLPWQEPQKVADSLSEYIEKVIFDNY